MLVRPRAAGALAGVQACLFPQEPQNLASAAMASPQETQKLAPSGFFSSKAWPQALQNLPGGTVTPQLPQVTPGAAGARRSPP